MDEKQIQILIGIRERLMIQLMMVSRLIDYWINECHGKANIELLTEEQIEEVEDEIIFMPDESWVDDLEDYLNEEDFNDGESERD